MSRVRFELKQYPEILIKTSRRLSPFETSRNSSVGFMEPEPLNARPKWQGYESSIFFFSMPTENMDLDGISK